MSAPKTITHLLPTGAIILWGGSDMPSGFLLCNGAEVASMDYPELAQVLDVTGDTITLPDYRDRVPQGAGTNSPNVSVEAGVPQLYGYFHCRNTNETADYTILAISGIFTCTQNGVDSERSNVDGISSRSVPSQYFFDANGYNSIYTSSCSTVQPPALTSHFLIKV